MSVPLLTLLIVLSAAMHIQGEVARARPRVVRVFIDDRQLTWRLRPEWRVYLFKPLTTSLIIVLALTAAPSASSSYKTLVIAGLLFSLMGDIFLMLPADRFLAGLVSFLIAHLCYIAAFTRAAGFGMTPRFAVPYLIFAGVMAALLWPHVKGMRMPVFVYLSTILIMGWQAAEQWGQMQTRSALAAACGGLLFVLSDALLALDRFRRPFPSARLMVLTTYYGAQWLIALSIDRG